MKFKEADIKSFKEQICCSCDDYNKICINKNNSSWFASCPRFFNWKTGYHNFVTDWYDFCKAHPEEAHKKSEEILEIAKANAVRKRTEKRLKAKKKL